MISLRTTFALLLIAGSIHSEVACDGVLHFNLKSVEGEHVTLTVREVTRERRLIVEVDSLKRICIDDFLYLTAARVLDSTFLELQFGVRAGSGISCESYYLVCVFSGALRTAFYGDAFQISDQTNAPCPTNDQEVKELDVWENGFALKRNIEDYTLRVTQHHIFNSECTPSENIEFSDTLEMKFDESYGVFCNRIDTISGEFGEFSERHNSSVDRLDNVVCPVVSFTKSGAVMYFFRGGWCFESERGRYLCGSGLNCYYEY